MINDNKIFDFFHKLVLPDSADITETNMLMVYYNECGRFIENKLSLESFIPSGNISLSKIKRRISNYVKWKKLSLNENYKEIDSVIHVNEISHLREMMPVYNILKEKYKILFISNNLNTLRFIESKSLPYINLYNQLNFFENEIFYSTNTLRNDYNHAIDTLNVLDSRKKTIEKFLKSKFIVYCNQTRWYTKLIKSYKIKFAFVANDLTSEGRLFTMICKENNISTFSVQHGNIYSDWISRHHIVDTFFTHGKLATNILNETNYTKINVIESGSPFVNNLIKNKDIIKLKSDELARKHLLPVKYVLIALSGYGHLTSKGNYFDCLNSIEKLISTKPSTFFVIKLHKKENVRDYDFISEKSNVKIVYEKSPVFNLEFSIFPWIMNSTMLITGSSTAAVEAMLLNKPVISLDFNDEYSSVDFINREASINVNTKDDLIRSFDNIDELQDRIKENSVSIVKDYFGDSSNNSGKIIADYIVSKYAHK